MQLIAKVPLIDNLSFSDCSDRNNNFDLLRLSAAFLVMFSHCFSFLGKYSPLDSVLGYVGGGPWGVAIFFVISGYLVTGSLERRSLKSYLWSRALRIFPALIVVVVLTVLLFGTFATALPLGEYLSNYLTWRYLINITVFNQQLALPGVFKINSSTLYAINGPLWTLPGEAAFYLLIPFVLFVKRQKILIVSLLFISILISYLIMRYIFGFPNGNIIYITTGIQLFPASSWAAMFLAGSFLSLMRNHSELNGSVAFIMLVMLLIASNGIAQMVVFHIAMPYLVIYLGTRRSLIIPGFKTFGDISYGFYIYASPVQMLLIHKFGIANPITLLLIAMPIITLLGSGLVDQSQKITVAARAIAERKAIGHLS